MIKMISYRDLYMLNKLNCMGKIRLMIRKFIVGRAYKYYNKRLKSSNEEIAELSMHRDNFLKMVQKSRAILCDMMEKE